MGVKMPENKEKNIENKPSLQDILNEYMGEPIAAPAKKAEIDAVEPGVVGIKSAATQEEDDWEWLESIKSSISDGAEEDDFIPPFLDDTVVKSEEKQPDLYEKAHNEETAEKKEIFAGLKQKVKMPERKLKSEKTSEKADESEEKISFWKKMSKLMGIEAAPETAEEPVKEAVIEPEVEEVTESEEFIQPEPEKKAKPKLNITIIENGKPWNLDDAVLEESETEDKDIDPDAQASYADEDYDAQYTKVVKEKIAKGEEQEEKSLPPIFATVLAFLGQRFSVLNEKRKAANAEELADSVIEEPTDLAKEAKRYARPVSSLTFRSRFAFGVSLLMAILAGVFEVNGRGWFGIGENGVLMTGVLMVLQLVVMLLCIEVPLRGICSLIKGKVTAETLVAMSCFITFIDGIVILLSRNADRGLSYAVVSAFSVVFGMRGLRSYYIGMRNSLRIASKVQAPWGIVTDNESVEERSVLKRQYGAVGGFYKNLIRRDICEHIYTYAAPIMLIAAVVFAFMSTVVRGRGGEFIHALAALVAVAASFSCMSAYARPFRLVSAMARKVGCAIAGWTGADKIFSSDGAFITDNDLFPKGTQQVVGMRLTDIAGQYKAIECAGSLIIASGSGLEDPFREFMRKYNVTPVYVESFTCHEGGGIGGVIRGENILVGTAAFMNLMGVRMPEDIAKKDVIFMSINRKLAAMFAVRYEPSKGVQSSLVAMRDTRMNMLFALKDFNISPKMLQKKFKVSMDGVEYIPLSDCYKMEKSDELNETDAAGILSVGNLNSFADTVSKAAQLRQITVLNTAISLLGSVVGMFLVFYMCWNGPISSITSWAMVLFMFSMHLVTIILSNMVKRRK